jgi:hypothetical protein
MSIGSSTVELPAEYVIYYVLTWESPIFASTCEYQAVRFVLCSTLKDASKSHAPDEVDFASKETKKLMAGTDDTVAWSCVRKGSFSIA